MRATLLTLTLAAIGACSQPTASSPRGSEPPKAPGDQAEQPDDVVEHREALGAHAGSPGYDKRVDDVRRFIAKNAPSSELAVIVEPPFIVVGDESEDEVRWRARRTVRWAVHRLKDGFFDRDPDRALTIWLFNGERSYRQHALALWDDRPDTPYGYYSSANNALVMNIATGGGTLIHELVHPYVEANFPDSPPWLNEGLGSLFEASGERDGKIVGMLNWRLPGLQEDIRDKGLIKFSRLMALDEAKFYGRGSGSHYAQARYLLYYLQEKGLLHRYYRAFVRDAGKDPTGHATLRAILERDDIDKFQREWEAWVLALRWKR